MRIHASTSTTSTPMLYSLHLKTFKDSQDSFKIKTDYHYFQGTHQKRSNIQCSKIFDITGLIDRARKSLTAIVLRYALQLLF